MTERYLNTTQAKQLAVQWAKAEPTLRIYITAVIGDSHLIDDIVQEVATIATEKFETFDPDREFTRWALGIARHRIAKSIRSKVRDRHVFSTEMIVELADVVADLQPDAELRKAALHRCMSALRDRSRRILEMRYHWGHRVQAIAEELGMSRVAVSAVLLRSRKALGDCIEKRLNHRGSRR